MSLPVIRGVSALNWPFTMTLRFLTGVGQWQNGAQQRWVRLPSALVRFTVPYPALTQAQKNTVKAAVTSAKGRFDNTLTISGPFNGGLATYSNLGIDDDEWIATEAVTTQYNAPLKISQSITQGLSPGTAGTAFPMLANGSMGVLPYKQKKRFQTVQTRMEQGPAYSYAEFGGGLTGYPTDGLMAFEFNEDRLSDADTSTRIAHFVANFGKAFSFTFTDEDSTAYTKTHYASDELAITFKGPNNSSMNIMLEATF
jgi:hypothetical protein